ncbi:MAG TPA: pyridoxal-5'-phosphate-dependent protein, partial [Candidatus Angelobacter sp.]|nr:pyridoxal-5'-phosphate-dependent protein [Candidatus Angelobacter sp.]
MVQGEARQLPQAIADLAGQVAEAADRIRQSVTETSVEQITGLVPDAGVDLIFKLENLQQTGSFKLRGA